MIPEAFGDSLLLLFILLNPFLMSVYLLELIRGVDGRSFARIMLRSCLISGAIFCLFAWTGDAFFRHVLQVDFGSFLIFGGIVFLILSIRYAVGGGSELQAVRGTPRHVSGSIALPIMIGPGTVSASVVAGSRLSAPWAATVIAVALALCALSMVAFKWLHDYVQRRNEPLVERYVDLVGRLSALIVGSIAIDMILRGVDLWWGRAA